MIRVVAALAAGLMFVGCAAGRYYGPPQTQLDADLRTRASFDLTCQADQLELTPLAKYATGIVASQGVSGCGKKATYVYRSAGTSGNWIMNTVAQ